MNTSLTSLNQEFKENENINIDFDIDVLDFWRQHEKKFPLLSQVAKRIPCVISILSSIYRYTKVSINLIDTKKKYR
jgi:hypothetical protein